MPHIHDKIDFTVSVFIVHGDKVLLRMHDKFKIWLAVGGHVELNEDPTQAAIREVKEEVGLDVTLWQGNQKNHEKRENFWDLTPPVFMNRHFITELHEHVDFVYFATSTTDNVVVDTTMDDASDQWVWATKEILETMKKDLKPNIYVYATEVLKTLAK